LDVSETVWRDQLMCLLIHPCNIVALAINGSLLQIHLGDIVALFYHFNAEYHGSK